MFCETIINFWQKKSVDGQGLDVLLVEDFILSFVGRDLGLRFYGPGMFFTAKCI